MNKHKTTDTLRRIAIEADEEHWGWENKITIACRWAADEIEQLRDQICRLRRSEIADGSRDESKTPLDKPSAGDE